jgi:5-methylcytosine-specific restriction endonuclease McrA
MAERKCKRCGETKPVEDFGKAPECKLGRRSTCKACANVARSRPAPRPLDPVADTTLRRICRLCGEEKLLGEFGREKYARWGRGYRCRACITDKTAQWRKDNPEHYRTMGREHMRRLAEVQPDAMAAATFTRNARARGAEIVELVVPLVVLERDDGVCGICGEDVDPFHFTIDHIVACRDGGEHSYANVQLAHNACNIRKGVKERDARKAAA